MTGTPSRSKEGVYRDNLFRILASHPQDPLGTRRVLTCTRSLYGAKLSVLRGICYSRPIDDALLLSVASSKKRANWSKLSGIGANQSWGAHRPSSDGAREITYGNRGFSWSLIASSDPKTCSNFRNHALRIPLTHTLNVTSNRESAVHANYAPFPTNRFHDRKAHCFALVSDLDLLGVWVRNRSKAGLIAGGRNCDFTARGRISACACTIFDRIHCLWVGRPGSCLRCRAYRCLIVQNDPGWNKPEKAAVTLGL